MLFISVLSIKKIARFICFFAIILFTVIYYLINSNFFLRELKNEKKSVDSVYEIFM